MFARSVTMRLKPNAVSEFNKTLEKEVLPLLQKQKGFRDELTLVSSNGSEVLGISLWDQKQDAEAYNRAAYYYCVIKLQFVVELFRGITPLFARPTAEALRGIY